MIGVDVVRDLSCRAFCERVGSLADATLTLLAWVWGWAVENWPRVSHTCGTCWMATSAGCSVLATEFKKLSFMAQLIVGGSLVIALLLVLSSLTASPADAIAADSTSDSYSYDDSTQRRVKLVSRALTSPPPPPPPPPFIQQPVPETRVVHHVVHEHRVVHEPARQEPVHDPYGHLSYHERLINDHYRTD